MKKTTSSTKQYLALTIDPASIDSAKKQFNVVLATETPVFRRASYLNDWAEDFMEVLVCDKARMRTQRMDNGVCPLLDNHDQYSGAKGQYGSLISYEISDGEVRGTIQYSLDPAKDGLWKDIEGGIIRGISARYIPWTYERQAVEIGKTAVYRAIDWEITEISMAPVPADYNSMVRSNDSAEKFPVSVNNFSNSNTRSNMEKKPNGEGNEQQPNTPEGQEQARSQGNGTANTTVQNPVNVEQVRAQAATEERTRILGIRTAVRTAGLEDSVAEELISAGTSMDAARSAIFDKMAAKQQASNPAPRNTNAVIADEGDAIRAAMGNVILHRVNPGTVKLEGKAVEMRGMKLLDMARHFLQEKGINPFTLNQNEQVARAIATTDFPDLLSSTTSRELRRYFDHYNSGSWKKIANRTSLSDFRTKTGVQVDSSIGFDKIAEGGEYKATKFMQNSKATISLDTYGRLIKITRQAIINDDLDVFGKVPQMIAQGAANMQAKMVWDLILTNAKTPDGTTLFHANHGNLAGAGAAISEASINAALTAIMLQKSPMGEEIMLQPKYLIVPVEKQVEAQKLLTAIIANQTSGVNVFANAFELITEVRLSRNSATAWYMAADPSTVEGLVYAYLDGEDGIYTETERNFKDDSIETKARLDFGVAAWEYRGFYKNPGA